MTIATFFLESYIADVLDREAIENALQTTVMIELRQSQMITWFIHNTDITPEYAAKYAEILISKNISTIDKLSKKLERNPRLLFAFGIDDEYDVQQILKVLNLQELKPSRLSSTSVLSHASPEGIICNEK